VGRVDPQKEYLETNERQIGIKGAEENPKKAWVEKNRTDGRGGLRGREQVPTSSWGKRKKKMLGCGNRAKNIGWVALSGWERSNKGEQVLGSRRTLHKAGAQSVQLCSELGERVQKLRGCREEKKCAE